MFSSAIATERIRISMALLDRLDSSGVNVRQLRSAMLSPHEFASFFESLEGIARSPDVGLQLATNVSPHQLDVSWLAALHAPALGEALKTLARYFRIVCAGHIDVALRNGEAQITYHAPDDRRTAPRPLVDYVFASILALARQGTARRLVPARLQLARVRSNETSLKRHFGCEVLFNAPLDTLVFEGEALAQPFVTRNDDLLAALLPALEKKLEGSSTPHSLADEVRDILSRHMDGQRISVEVVAGEMQMSTRTLQRHLEKAGTSYQKLLDGVRRDTARRLLAQTSARMGQIAFLLGFDDVNSFTRAFYGWQGATPARWRRRVELFK